MKLVELNKKFASDEDYFAFEESSQLKHELINGNLYEMSGSSKYHNPLERFIANFLENLSGNQYEVFIEGFKIKTPNGNFFIRM
jgi:Uma2 family endonuclease